MDQAYQSSLYIRTPQVTLGSAAVRVATVLGWFLLS